MAPAFPFGGPTLTYARLKAILRKMPGVNVVDVCGPGEALDFDNTPGPALCFVEKEVRGQRVQKSMTYYNEADFVFPMVLESLCAELDIDPDGLIIL